MSSDDTVLAYILDTQMKVFEDARLELQLSVPKIAERAKIDVSTVRAWAQGRNALSLWGLKKLLRVRELAPLLSRLFEPEEYVLAAVMSGIDHDEVARILGDYMRTKHEYHHKDSEAGPAIGPNEHKDLCAKLSSVVSLAA